MMERRGRGPTRLREVNMPDAGWYVDVPLEATYAEAWEGFPAPWKADLVGD